LDANGSHDPVVRAGGATLIGAVRVWEIILIAFFAAS